MKMADDELLKAKKKALTLLTDRDHSVAELKKKLKRSGYSDEAADEAIAYAGSFGYLDDDRYADHYIQFYSQSRSRQKIYYDLIGKGVDPEVIERAFERAGDYDEKPLIRTLVQKKLKTFGKSTSGAETKVIQSLMRKGFSMGDVRSVLDDMDIFTDGDEDE